MPKRARNRSAAVPWMNAEQLNQVYSYLFSDSLSKKRWAVDQIAVWDTRCYPSLPTGIESTVNIIRAIIHDMLYKADKTFCQEKDIVTLYSFAIVRFVNLTLEHHQKASNKIRMSFLASKLNIPSWLVDLRNEIVHSYCPSLSVLRLGAEVSLQYLEETFWSKEVVNAKPKSNPPSERDAEIVNLINQYKNLQFQRTEDPELKQVLSKDFKDVLKKISRVILHDREKFISILVQPGNFIAAEEVKKLISITGPFLAQDDNLILPIELQKFWAPLLRKIHFKDLMPMFLEKLLLAQAKCSNRICQKVAIAWAMQIILGISKTNFLSDCFRKKGVLLNLPCLLYASLKGITPYSFQLFSAFLTKYKNTEKLDCILYLMALYQGYFRPNESSSSKRKSDIDQEIVFTVEDAEEDLREARAKRMRSQDSNIWSSPSVTMDFSNIPIGGVLTPANLDATQDQQSLEDSQKEQIKIEPSEDDNFIIINKNDGGGTVEEITHHINTFPDTTRLQNFDMVYRRRPKQ